MPLLLCPRASVLPSACVEPIVASAEMYLFKLQGEGRNISCDKRIANIAFGRWKPGHLIDEDEISNYWFRDTGSVQT